MEIVKLNSLYAKLKFTVQELQANLPIAIHNKFSVYVENFKYIPKYKNGMWDGKISFFNRMSNTIKLGLLSELEDWIFDNFPDIEITGYTKSLDDSINVLELPNSDFIYYDDQRRLIYEALRHKTGVIESATGSGKSVMIAGIIYNIMKQKQILEDIILVVPTIDLVNQMYENFESYGLDISMVGKVGGGNKDFTKPIIITTWQSLGSPFIKRKKGAKPLTKEQQEIKNYFKYKMKLCKLVIFDECHLVKSMVLNKIIENMTQVQYKIGLTGTLPTNDADLWTVFGNIGEQIGENRFSDLIDAGRLADVEIKLYKINYPKKYKKKIKIKEYEDFMQQVISCPVRLLLIKEVLKNNIDTSLILVNRIEHGKNIEKYLKEQLPDREIYFLHGTVKSDIRAAIIAKARISNNIIIIATVKLFSMGIDIKRLKYLIFAHIGKAEIAVFQSIGRTLRKFSTKIACVIDIGSNLRFDKQHTIKRMAYYKKRLAGKIELYEIGTED